MSKIRLVVILSLAFMFAGCVQTRRDIQQASDKKQMSNLQTEKVSLENQVSDLQSDMRDLMGRLEVMEKSRQDEAALASQAKQDSGQKNEERIKAYEETITLLESQIKDMQVEVAALKKVALSSLAVRRSKPKAKAPRGPFYVAEAAFNAKDWQKAITGYQSYREKYPKGRKYKDSTYKIGVCFQELGMLTEAKAFFDEVIERYPKAKEARKARRRLKSL